MTEFSSTGLFLERFWRVFTISFKLTNELAFHAGFFKGARISKNMSSPKKPALEGTNESAKPKDLKMVLLKF